MKRRDFAKTAFACLLAPLFPVAAIAAKKKPSGITPEELEALAAPLRKGIFSGDITDKIFEEVEPLQKPASVEFKLPFLKRNEFDINHDKWAGDLCAAKPINWSTVDSTQVKDLKFTFDFPEETEAIKKMRERINKMVAKQYIHAHFDYSMPHHTPLCIRITS